MMVILNDQSMFSLAIYSHTFSLYSYMTFRTPYDGQPFYCNVCCMGLYDMIKCNRNDCDREDVTTAQWRKEKLNKNTLVWK